ncbi:hypothetical protein GIB67_000718 [Kingdonia uniflora]|uniref:RRM domain-containing protein n=1 Tax=Kingdonia uniflora TaxID=39325 RepID=A0A7J7NDK3_9MAGN|nr:hypothetical protein GIB67_000718 [Kingdonia uniflora]
MSSKPGSLITNLQRRARRSSWKISNPLLRKSFKNIRRTKTQQEVVVLEKLEALKNLIPAEKGEVMKTDKLFEQTADYIVFLRTQVEVLQRLVEFYDGSSRPSDQKEKINLSDSIDNGKLYETFARFGNFSSCTVAATSEGKNKGYGFIQFNLEESATAAINNLNGSMIGDKQMLLKDEKYTNLMYYNYVAKFIKRSCRLFSQDEKYTNLHMKNLDEK